MGWGLLCMILFLVAAEIGVFRNLDLYGYSPGFIGQIAHIKKSFEHADGANIELAVFGDSEGIDALRPDLLARDLPLDAGQIFNFSISGGRAYDIAQMYKTYIDRMPNLKTVVVEVNEFQLNSSQASGDIKFRYFAGLRDRLKVIDRHNYGELLLGWALKSYDMRTIWSMMVNKLFHGGLFKEVPLYIGGLPAETWSPKSDKTSEYAAEVADRWFENYAVGGVETEAFEEMADDLRRRGLQVLIVHLPRTEYFEQAVQQKFVAEQQAYFNEIRTVADRNQAAFAVLSNDGLGLDDFRDANHVSPQGAEKVSRAVAQNNLGRLLEAR